MGDNSPSSETFTLVCIVPLSPDEKNIAILAKRFNDELKLYVARYNEILQRIIEKVQSYSTNNSPPVEVVIYNPKIVNYNTLPLPVNPSNLAQEDGKVVMIEMLLDHIKGYSKSSIEGGVKSAIKTLRTTEQGPDAAVNTIDENGEQFKKMIAAIINFIKGDDKPAVNKQGGNKQSRSFRNSSSRSSHRRASSRSSKKRNTKRKPTRRQRSAYRRTR